MKSNSLLLKPVSVAALAAATLLTGCALTPTAVTTEKIAAAVQLTGSLHGGQQPVKGATINMMAVGSTGYASPAVSILNSGVSVTTDANGNFNLTNAYTCPSASSLIYITAIGGDTGSCVNSASAMMAGLGACGNLSASTFIYINEVSTVAAVHPLAPFMTSPTAVGSSPSNTLGITNAFTDMTSLATLSTGSTPGAATPSNGTMPVATINTLANILAACINTNGPSSGSCSQLFNATSVNGVAPTETITALLNIAKNPGTNVAVLYNMTTAAPPFQPALSSAPSDFLLAASYALPVQYAGRSVVDATGSPWISSFNALTRLNPNGSVLFSNTLQGYSGLSIDQSGNAWTTYNAKLNKTTPAGVSTTYTGNGLTTGATGIAIDGQGQIWVANYSSTGISAFSNAGAALPGSPFTAPFNTQGIVFNAH